MNGKFWIDRIYERDADLVLIEELNVSQDFCKWILGRTSKFAIRQFEGVEAYASIFDSSGETDITVVFSAANGESFALLIENKIDAVFQESQISRYFQRGSNGQDAEQWSDFEVVVIAPSKYIEKNGECKLANSCITYEEVAEFFRKNEQSKRSRYRAAFFDNALPRAASAYFRIQDEETNEFWLAAYQLARDEFPILEMRKPNYAKGATWVIFKPADFPRRLSVDLKADKGFVDLTFSGVDFAALARTTRPFLDGSRYVHKAGKSAVIRQNCTPFTVTQDFSSVAGAMREAFGKCSQAIDFFRRHDSELSALLP